MCCEYRIASLYVLISGTVFLPFQKLAICCLARTRVKTLNNAPSSFVLERGSGSSISVPEVMSDSRICRRQLELASATSTFRILYVQQPRHLFPSCASCAAPALRSSTIGPLFPMSLHISVVVQWPRRSACRHRGRAELGSHARGKKAELALC